MSTAPDLAGTQVGRYRIAGILGSGGMGVVYDAVDTTLGRHVALKLLPPANAERLDRFVTEARAASALNHPHLVSIYEIGSSGAAGATTHFIAMEKVDGWTLREILAREPLPFRKAIEIMMQVTDAVAAAHSVGVVHRDLKPENIMVSAGGYAKVLDFGLAKLREEPAAIPDDEATAPRTTATGMVMGTAPYMSPEQAEGRNVDARSDVFSLGCILYEVLSGRRAFRGSSRVDTLHMVIHGEPEPLAGAPAEAERIVRKAMAKDRDDRYQSAKDLAVDLRALLRSPVAPTRNGKRYGAITAAAAAAVIVAAVAGVLVWRRAQIALRPVAAIQMQRLTARGDVVDACISPDGRFILFTVRDEKGTSLSLKQIGSAQDLLLVPPSAAYLWGAAFTPDGSAVVYGWKTAQEPRGMLYRIPILGGVPERIATSPGVDSRVTFSPDGKRMAWLRSDFPKAGESALMVANVDGTGERALATRRPPELFAPQFFTQPSWSPDGKLIAAAVRRTQQPIGATVVLIDPESGSERPLGQRPWFAVTGLQWLPDQSGLIAIAASTNDAIDPFTLSPVQLWTIAYPSGVPRAITNDPLIYYRAPTISADGRKLVVVAADARVHISRLPITGGPSEKISSGRYDGLVGVAQLRDGRIVFTVSERGTNPALWIMNGDGSGRRRFVNDTARNDEPYAFSEGVAYVSTNDNASELCVVDQDGQNRRVVVPNIDDAPVAISADGKWVVYSRSRRLWLRAAAGGTPLQLTSDVASSPVYSPAGDRIAFVTGDLNHPQGNRLVVTTADGRNVVWSTPVPREGDGLRWMPDGNSLLLLNFDSHNLWLFPLHGTPRRFTNLESMLWSFDVAPDGKSIILGDGSIARDAELITGFD